MARIKEHTKYTVAHPSQWLRQKVREPQPILLKKWDIVGKFVTKS